MTAVLQIELYQALTGIGVSDVKATEVVKSLDEAIEEKVNTGIQAVRADIAEMHASLRTSIADLRAEVRADIAELRTEIRSEVKRLDGRMADLRLFVGWSLTLFGLLVSAVSVGSHFLK